MGFSYKPLFKLMVDRNMKKTDLHTEAGLSSATLAKLSKGEPLSGESIEKLCVYFRCQVGDLVEYIFEDVPAKTPDAGKPAQPSRQKAIHKPAASGVSGKTKRGARQ